MTEAEESLLSLARCHSATSMALHFSPALHSFPPPPPPTTSGETEAVLLPRVPSPPPPERKAASSPAFTLLSPDPSGSYPSSTLLLFRDDLKEARLDLLARVSSFFCYIQLKYCITLFDTLSLKHTELIRFRSVMHLAPTHCLPSSWSESLRLPRLVPLSKSLIFRCSRVKG